MRHYQTIVYVTNKTDQDVTYQVTDREREIAEALKDESSVAQELLSQLDNRGNATAPPGAKVIKPAEFLAFTSEDIAVTDEALEQTGLTRGDVLRALNYGWDLDQRKPIKARIDPNKERSRDDAANAILKLATDREDFSLVKRLYACERKEQVMRLANELGV